MIQLAALFIVGLGLFIVVMLVICVLGEILFALGGH